MSGTGPEAAERAAFRLAEEGVDALASWGCAAALAPGLKPGDLIVPEAVRSADGTVCVPDWEWRRALVEALGAQMPITGGDLAESRGLVADADAKRLLRDATSAAAVDMESAAVGRVAASRNLPFVTVRAIADTAAMHLPAAVLHALDSRGEVALPKLLGYSFRHPGQFPELVRLGRAFDATMTTLRRVRNLAGPNFCCPPTVGGDFQPDLL